MKRWERWCGAAALVMAVACGDTNGNGTPAQDVPLQDVLDTTGTDGGVDAGDEDSGPEDDLGPPDVDVTEDVPTAPDVLADTSPDAEVDTTPDVADADAALDTETDGGPPPAGEGETCATAIVVDAAALPWTWSGDTSTLSDDYTTAGCGTDEDAGGDYGDAVFAFTPTVSGAYTLELADLGGDGPTILYVATDCGNFAGTCLGWSDDLYSSREWTLPLDAGTTYYVVLDGYILSDYGPYALTFHAPCVPSCDGKVCGGDGCGGPCGTCPDGELCDLGGQCVDASLAPGNNCNVPFEVTTAPFEATGDTSLATNDFSVSADACAEDEGPFGAGSNDQVYHFVPPLTGLYTLRVTPDDPDDFDAALYVLSACDGGDSACLAAGDGYSSDSVEVALEADVAVWVVVDGYGAGFNDDGAYTLAIEAPCVPSCDGKVCGDDGCGGTCGACDPGDFCDATAGQCVDGASLPGNTCENPFVVDAAALPFTGSGDTSLAGNTYATAGGQCGGGSAFGSGAPDQVWSFTPADTGLYTLSLTLDGFWDSAFYVASDCGDFSGTCLDSADGTELEVVLEGGVTYFIVVDGYSSASGSYTLEVSAPCVPQCDGLACGDDGCQGVCGTCPDGEVCSAGQCLVPAQGDTCFDPYVVGALPFVTEGTTEGLSADYAYEEGQCPGMLSDAYGAASGDAVYALTAEVDGVYTAILEADFDSNLYAVTDCASIGTSCLAADEAIGGSEAISFALTAGETAFVVVDGWSNGSNVSGTYTLTVEAPCLPSCDGLSCGDDGCGGSCGTCGEGGVCDGLGQCVDVSGVQGNTCTNPWVMGAAPFTGTGDTTDADNVYWFGDGDCEGLSYGYGEETPDEAWRFTADVAGDYTFTLTPDFDAVLYVTRACSSWSDRCLGADDGFVSEEVTVTLGEGESVYVIVDGYEEGEVGSYELSVTLD